VPTSNLSERRSYLEWLCSVAMRYHGKRRSFLESFSRLEPLTTFVNGGATFGALTNGWPEFGKYAALATATLGAVNLTCNCGERARLHGDLFRRWSTLRGKLAELLPDDDIGFRRLEVERAGIDGDTPGQLEALSVVCENEERQARRSSQLSRVYWYQRILAQWFTLPPWNFLEELPKNK
jgi:hypothetical protein